MQKNKNMKTSYYYDRSDIPFGKHFFMADIPSHLGREKSERYYFKISSWFADKIDGNVDIDTCLDELEDTIKEYFRVPKVPCYNGILRGIYGNCFVLEVINQENRIDESGYERYAWGTASEAHSDIFESRVALTTELERYLDDELKSFSEYIANSGLWDEETDRKKIISSVTTVIEKINRNFLNK